MPNVDFTDCESPEKAMRSMILDRGRNYEITSYGNGLSYVITRLSDGKSVSIQGDDAPTFRTEWEHCSHRYTMDDLCSEYDHVMH